MQKSVKIRGQNNNGHGSKSIKSVISMSRHGDSFRTCGEGDRENNGQFEECFDMDEEEGQQLVHQKTIGGASEGTQIKEVMQHTS